MTAMETAEKTIGSTQEVGAVHMSPSTPLLDSIMDAIRNTPHQRHEYVCHGNYHCDYYTDYKAIRAKIDALLSNVEGHAQGKPDPQKEV